MKAWYNAKREQCAEVGTIRISEQIGENWFGGTSAFPQNFPRVTNLRMDPFEEVIGNLDNHRMYFRWAADKLWIYQPMQTFVGKFLQSFKEFPQRQKPSIIFPAASSSPLMSSRLEMLIMARPTPLRSPMRLASSRL